MRAAFLANFFIGCDLLKIETNRMVACDAHKTAALLPFGRLVEAIAKAALDLASGRICAPARQVVPFADGSVMMSMPATAPDVCVHKLVNVVPSNRRRGLPTISGIMSVYEGRTGQLRLVMDGPTATSRRTAAVSMLGLRLLRKCGPRRVTVIGTGAQAASHVEALTCLYPRVPVDIIGHTLRKARVFAKGYAARRLSVYAAEAVHHEADVVITVTTSATPVYDEPPRTDRLVIGVGAYRPELAEISPRVLSGSHLYVDDLTGARQEAGDLLQAGVDWTTVGTLASLLQGHRSDGAAVFKTVGCSAWDLAAARCALNVLKEL